MKRLVSAFLPVFFVVCAMGQNGNEWIRYSQSYVKIPVGEDGIYRISFEALQRAGFPTGADPRQIQLFHRGKEQAIHIEGEQDGVFHAADFIEFYGRKNDGTLDATLYEDPAHQPHRYYNLYSDTTAYFLTLGSSNGKRMAAYAGAGDAATAAAFHHAEQLLVLSNAYSAGRDYGSVQLSTFDAGEGWMGSQILHGQQLIYTLDGISHGVPSAGDPVLEVLLTGRGPMSHNVELSAGARVLTTVSFDGFESYKHSQAIAWSDVDATGKLEIKVRVTGANGPDRISTGYVRLRFPQQVTMSNAQGKIFYLDASEDFTALQIAGPAAGTRLFDITDPSAPVLIPVQWNATLDANIDRSAVSRKILATARTLTPSSLKRIHFRQINPSQHDYVIITHPSLRRPALGYVDPVKAFAEYKSLPEGGGYDTLIVNIDQLYDQFNYGETSPRAIYQFMKFCASVKVPEFLFLIGKGLDVHYGYHRNPSAFTSHKDLVPTAGFPASDVLFTAGLSGAADVPAVATGRLTANSPADVATYLNKVKDRDALPYTDLNRKRILHLSGGIEENEPQLFRQILEVYQLTAEDLFLGGKVKAIAKQSTDIKLVNIADEVNKGVGMVTFFGHSAPNTLDFDIGLVSDPIMGYNNSKKYPFMLMNGCDAGSFFLNTTIIGENWIKTPDKGAIGFIAHSSFGLTFGLQVYSNIFYDVAFKDSVFVKKGVGSVQREVAKRLFDDYGKSPSYTSQVQQMVLLGDPSIPIFGARKPDYAPVQEGVSISSFNDEPVTAFSDSFRIDIPIRNYGIASPENFRVNVRREYGGGQVVEYDTIVASVLFEDTLRMTLRNRDSMGYGINVLTVHVDADGLISELTEANNKATLEYFIPLNGTRNLFPYNNSIVSDRKLQLSFQFTDLLSGPRDFVLQIDTTGNFDSPYLQEHRINAQVLARLQVALSDEDSLVYFWRTRIADPLESESKDWTTSSFSYIHDGPEGWAQLHFHQHEKNPRAGLVSDPELRRIEFQETVSDIAIKTFTSASLYPLDSVSFRVNGVEMNLLYEGGACRNNTINLVAFDRRSTKPYAGLYFKWYEAGRRKLCGREPYVINSFTPGELATGDQQDLIQYIDNIAIGDTVVLFNLGNAGYAQWPDAAKTKLGQLGISHDQLAAFQNGDAIIIFARKGSAPGTAYIFHATGAETAVKVERTIAGRFTRGSISSGTIGPARSWKKLISQVREVEDVDDFTFTLTGVSVDGKVDTLRTQVQSEEDLSFIDPGLYPYVRVLFETGDNVNVTASQLSKWLVLYEPLAEGMVVPREPVTQRTLTEGERVYGAFGFINVSNKSFADSVVVDFSLLNHSNGGSPSRFRIRPPAPGDTTVFSIPLDTKGKKGLNDLQVFANPRILPEQSFDNNFLRLPEYLHVLPDQAGPVLDVTFDGRHLLNNDYVSANPSIVMRVWDENRFLLKGDTTGIRIFLGRSCESDACEFEAVYFTRDDIAWYAATATSDFQVHFSPKDLESGVYRLRVEAEDASGNKAGEEPYEVTFRVEHNSSVSVTTAYPNPFNENMTIDVVVTGEHNVPIAYRMTIAAVNGGIIRELSDATNNLHVGLNRLSWDGNTYSGHAVPNGIYFYRLVIDGRSYFGKVLLVR